MRLLLIDATGITRRIWEAAHELAPHERAERLQSSALASFRRSLAEHQPTHALAAFDAQGPCWRHTLYPDYKQGRAAVDPLFHETSHSLCAALQSELGLHCLTAPDVEADDVLAAVTGHCMQARPQAEITIVSSDKDLCALITETVRVYHHFDRQWRDRQWVQDKLGVDPHQIVDFLALAGDGSDGIPGVRGIGPEKAARLLRNYGSLDTILQLPGGKNARPDVRRVQSQREAVLLSRQLAQPRTDIHLGLTWSSLARPA